MGRWEDCKTWISFSEGLMGCKVATIRLGRDCTEVKEIFLKDFSISTAHSLKKSNGLDGFGTGINKV